MNKFEKVSYIQYVHDLLHSPDYEVIPETDEVWDDVAKEYINARDAYDWIDLPRRSTARSAGYDFCVPISVEIPPGKTMDILTGIKVMLDPWRVLLLDVRSSMGIKNGLTLANTIGVVDADYYGNKGNDGHIHIVLRNNSDETVRLRAGDRFAQGIILEYDTVNDDFADGERNGGLGSTGRD